MHILHIFSVFSLYLELGIEHIIPKGFDHILFIAGVYFFTPKLKHIFWQVSMFTVAHTMSLALSSLGYISIPPSVIEPLIAASIVVIGIENIWEKNFHWHRLIVVFLFGLIHGLGFAGVLAVLGLDKENFIASLWGFNFGVEIGQLLVIAICWLGIGIWFQKKSWYKPFVIIPISLTISAVGLYWFIERIFFT